MSKGVMLTMDTVVIVILVALVLTAVLFFFTSTFGPTMNEIKAHANRDRYCRVYCDGNADDEVKKILADACDFLPGYTNCEAGSVADEPCLNQCCKEDYCPEEP